MVERLTCPDFLDQGGWNRLAGLIMLGICVENIGRQQPIFVHLAGIFDKIARGPAKARPGDVVIEIMNGMAKFVEQG